MSDYPFDIAQFHIEHEGQGSHVIFVHGFTLDARMWNNQWDVFKNHYHSIKYDLRGYGRSKLPGVIPDKPYAHYHDLHLLLQSLKSTPCIIIGLSLGGRIAIQCALEYPQDIKAIVLIDTAIDGYPWSKEYLEWIHSFEDAYYTLGIEKTKELWLRGKLFAGAMSNPGLSEELIKMVDNFPGYQWTNEDPSYQTLTPSFKRLENILCPVLTLVGEYDLPDFHGCANEIKKRVVGSTKIIVPNAGHCSNMENSEFINRSILDWLTLIDS